MAKKTKNAADAQELAATPTITIEEVKESFKKIIKFEYEVYRDCAQDVLIVDMGEFCWDDVKEYIDTMYDLQTAYFELDDIKDDSEDYDWIEDILESFENCYNALAKDSEEEFVEEYSELGIDEAVLQRIAKIVQDC